MKSLKLLENCTLHPHQEEGVQWLIDHWFSRINVIVADEMGLGKTLQSLAFFCYLLEENLSSGPFLVIAPLSVAPQWAAQSARFAPKLRAFEYYGSAVEREEKRTRLQQDQQFDMMVSSYETCLLDIEFISSYKWSAIVFDEGHRLKNPEGRTHLTFLERLRADFEMILTGTPVQNNATELWALLRFLNPEQFPESTRPEESGFSSTVSEMSDLVKKYVLRRLFSAVSSISLPPVEYLVIRTEMTQIQADLYRWALFQYAKSSSRSESQAATAGILSNLMMTLRKVASHPYLIAGVEPEPFAEGVHLWKNSNKFRVLRALLEKMRSEKSKCLIFSNFTSLLDICQDFLDLEKIGYERLDGSVRREDRMHAIDRFAELEREVFLLSTRAGGVGLNLTQANWVIFLDTDWNPQMDLQAIARAFRQGQTRTVKVFRLITKDTVDEIMLERAIEKLEFSKKILNEEKSGTAMIPDVKGNIKELILRGISKLQSAADPAGPMPVATRQNENDKDKLDVESLIESIDQGEQTELVVGDDSKNYKRFEGIDYSSINPLDVAAMDSLVQKAATATPMSVKPKNQMVDRIKKLTAENRIKRRDEKWMQIGYTSYSFRDARERFPSTKNGGEIFHLHGSFTNPSSFLSGINVVVHLVDSSGVWPTGSRLFMAVADAFPSVPRYYYQAKKASDLHLGDLHVLPVIEGSMFVALCVSNAESHFKVCLIKLASRFFNVDDVNFHFSRIGEQRGTLYLTERLIGKYLCAFGFNAFVYYNKAVPKKITIFDYFKKKSPWNSEKKIIPPPGSTVTVFFSPVILPFLRQVYAKDLALIGGTMVDKPPADMYVVSVKEGKAGIDQIARSLKTDVETSIPKIPLKKDSHVRAIFSTQLEHLLLKNISSV